MKVLYTLIEAHIKTFAFDIACLLETYFGSSFPIDDQRINFKGYCLLQEDHQTSSSIIKNSYHQWKEKILLLLQNV